MTFGSFKTCGNKIHFVIIIEFLLNYTQIFNHMLDILILNMKEST